MAAAVKTWTFTSGEIADWTFNDSGDSHATGPTSTTGGNTTGYLGHNNFGRNKTNDGHWAWTGTFEDLGVPAGATVTGYSAASFYGRCSVWNVVDSAAHGDVDTEGAMSINDGTTRSLIADQSSYSGTTSWAQTSNSPAISGLSLASTTSVTIYLHGDMDNANNASAESQIDWSDVSISVDYAEDIDITATKVSPTLSVKNATVQADVDTNITATKVSLALAVNAATEAGTQKIWVNDTASLTGAVLQPAPSSWADTSITLGALTKGTLGDTGSMFVAVERPDGELSNWYAWTAISGAIEIDATKVTLSLAVKNAAVQANVDIDVVATKVSPTLAVKSATVQADVDTNITATKVVLALDVKAATVQADVDLNITATKIVLGLDVKAATVQADVDTNITATKVALALVVYDTATSLGINIDATKVALSLAAKQATVNAANDITAAKVALGLVVHDATVQANVDLDIVADKVTLGLATYAAAVQANVDTDVTAGKVALTLSPKVATVQADVDINVTATKVVLALDAKTAQIQAGEDINIGASKVALSLAVKSATVQANVDLDITATKVALALAAKAAAVQANVDLDVTATKVALALATKQATVQADVDLNITATKVALSLAPKQADVAISSPVAIDATKVALALSVKAATVDVGVEKKVYVNSTPSLVGAVEQPWDSWSDTSITLGALTQGALGTGAMYVAVSYDGLLGNWYAFNATDTLVATKVALGLDVKAVGVGRHFGPATIGLVLDVKKPALAWSVYAAKVALTLDPKAQTIGFSPTTHIFATKVALGLAIKTAGVSFEDQSIHIDAAKVALTIRPWPAAFDSRKVEIGNYPSDSAPPAGGGWVDQPWSAWSDTGVTLGPLDKGGLETLFTWNEAFPLPGWHLQDKPRWYARVTTPQGAVSDDYPFAVSDYHMEATKVALGLSTKTLTVDLADSMDAVVETYLYPKGTTGEEDSIAATKVTPILSVKKATIKVSTAIAASLVSLSLAANPATVGVGIEIQATKVSLAPRPWPAVIRLNTPLTIPANKVSLTINPRAASIEIGDETVIPTEVAHLGLQTYPAEVSFTMQLNANKASLGLSPKGGAFSWPIEINAQTGEVDVYGHQPMLPPELGADQLRWDDDNKRWGGVDISYAEFVPVYPLDTLFFAAGQGSGFPSFKTVESSIGLQEDFQFISNTNTLTSGLSVRSNKIDIQAADETGIGGSLQDFTYGYPDPRPVNIERIWENKWALAVQHRDTTNAFQWKAAHAFWANFKDGNKDQRDWEEKFDAGSFMTWDTVGSGVNRGLALTAWDAGADAHLFPAYGGDRESEDNIHTIGGYTCYAVMYFSQTPDIETGIWLSYDRTDPDTPEGIFVTVRNNSGETAAECVARLYDNTGSLSWSQTIDLETSYPTWAAKVQQGSQLLIWARYIGNRLWYGLGDLNTDEFITLGNDQTMTGTFTAHSTFLFGQYPLSGLAANAKVNTVRLQYFGAVQQLVGAPVLSVPSDLWKNGGRALIASSTSDPNPNLGDWSALDLSWSPGDGVTKLQPDAKFRGNVAYDSVQDTLVLTGTLRGFGPASYRWSGPPLYYSTDRGATFAEPTGITLNPAENAYYAGMLNWLPQLGKFMYFKCGRLFYSSNGQSWTEASSITWVSAPSSGLDDGYSYDQVYPTSGFHELNSGTVLLNTSTGLLRSTDGGATWNEVNLSSYDPAVLEQVHYNYADDILIGVWRSYYLTNDVYTAQSTDEGSTWPTRGNNILDIPLAGAPPPSVLGYGLHQTYETLAYHNEFLSDGAWMWIPPTYSTWVMYSSLDGLNWDLQAQSQEPNSVTQEQVTDWLLPSKYAAQTETTEYSQDAYEVVIERIGLTLEKTDRFGNPKVDPLEIKLVRGIWPIFDGQDGQTIRCYIGSQMGPSDPIAWATPRDFVIGEDYFIDFRVSGRYVSLRFEADVSDPFVLLGYDLDVQPIGRR